MHITPEAKGTQEYTPPEGGGVSPPEGKAHHISKEAGIANLVDNMIIAEKLC